MSDFFPDDLIAVQRAVHEARHELSVFCRSAGMPGEEDERRRGLEKRVTELAAELYAHPFWTTLSGPELVDARAAIKHADGVLFGSGAEGA